MRALLVTLVALSLFAVACGDDGEDVEGGDDDASPSSSASTTAPATDAPTTTESTATTTTAAPRPEIPTPEVSDIESLLALDRPIVAAHAGGEKSWPDATMYAFTQAALAGTDVLEMDVQLTGDGVLVVNHDDTVDRTTETTGRLRDLTYEELQALDSAYWWSEEGGRDLPEEAYVYRGIRTGDVAPPEGFTADDFRVETFRAVAEAFPDHVLDVEIKIPDADDGTSDVERAIEGARVLAEEIEALGRTDSVIVVSFVDDVTAAFREFAPHVATSPGLSAIPDWFLGADVLTPADRVLQVPPEYDGITILTELFFGLAAEDGLEVWVWPPGSQETADFYQEFIELGADGVIAGRPAEAVERYREVFGD